MRHRRIFVGLLLLLAAGGALADGPSVNASHVWIREAPPGTEVMAGYLTLTNRTRHALALNGITSPDFGEVRLQNGTQAVKALTLPTHASVTLGAGGDHLVLMRPARTFHVGDFVTLTITFSDGSSLAILAPVRRNPPPS
ncbi:MAG: copper chaperone PCu(A)C [Gammaproteobacteria bacterium]|nr:copper chaperone PCu(A)C [Gammaproteobacteria bacterium]